MKRTVYLIACLSLCSTFIRGQSKSLEFWTYGGANFGAFRFQQGPMDTRAWEFNNYVDVSEKMTSNRSFSGYNLGAVLNIVTDMNRDIGFPIGIEYSHFSNKMSGTRDSASVTITQQYIEQLNSFYFGLGLSTFNRPNKNGKARKFSIGYIPYFSLSRAKIKDQGSIGSKSFVKSVIFEGRVINLKNMFYINYRLNTHLMLSLHPYLENHIFDGAADLVYNDPKTHTFEREIYNLKNYGTTLCINYKF